MRNLFVSLALLAACASTPKYQSATEDLGDNTFRIEVRARTRESSATSALRLAKQACPWGFVVLSSVRDQRSTMLVIKCRWPE